MCWRPRRRACGSLDLQFAELFLGLVASRRSVSKECKRCRLYPIISRIGAAAISKVNQAWYARKMHTASLCFALDSLVFHFGKCRATAATTGCSMRSCPRPRWISRRFWRIVSSRDHNPVTLIVFQCPNSVVSSQILASVLCAAR